MNSKAAEILAFGMIISAFIFGAFFSKAQKQKQIIRVVGSASQEYSSDILKWQITLGTQSGINDLNSGFKNISASIESLKKLLSENGFNPNDLTINPSYSYPMYDQTGKIASYNLEQTLTFTVKDTTKFANIEKLCLDQSNLYDRKILLRNSQLQYYISKLPELKHNIIAEATKDAKERASQVAKSSKSKVGKLLNARVGVFQITEPNSTEVQAYGVYNTNTRQKQITVTVTSEFELK
jgi:hypothetical protein